MASNIFVLNLLVFWNYVLYKRAVGYIDYHARVKSDEVVTDDHINSQQHQNTTNWKHVLETSTQGRL